MLEIEKALIDATYKLYDLANGKLGTKFEYPEIRFDVRGTCGGRANSFGNYVRYNLQIAENNLQAYIAEICPHEVGHVLSEKYHRRDCGHGPLWKRFVKYVLGAEPHRTHSLNTANCRTRKQIVHLYVCNCEKPIPVGNKYHKIIQSCGGKTFSCRRCGTQLHALLFSKSVDIRTLV